jgi:glycosyltransferase involved in cell wall biosynthesis
MFLSVIIPTFKRRETLSTCLKHLSPEAQSLSSDLFEVVVTDDGRDEETRDFLLQEFSWVRHNHGPQKGPAANRNSGAKASRGDWLLFLDDDCLPQPAFLSAYADAIKKDPHCRVFEGSTLPERPQNRLDEEAPINDHGGYLWSCNFLINRKLFFDIGGFCELYPYACMEDVDFREQLRARDIQFLFVPEASVIHPWRPLTPDDKFLKMRVISHAIFFTRYPAMKPSLLTTFRSILRGWILGLLMEAPRLKFRGFWRYFGRLATITQYQFANWSGSGRKQL